MTSPGRRTAVALLLGWLFLAIAVVPLPATAEPPAPLALIIDDLGDRWDYGQRALALPGAVTYAILPGTPYGPRLARFASEAGREVLLHQPMEALEVAAPGAGSLDSQMSREQFVKTLRANLDALPQVHGVNNHMGSRLTRDPQAMAWLMSELRLRGGLYFVDSRTIGNSVAQRVARHEGVASIGRDLFLDHVRTSQAIELQLIKAVRLARERGGAVAIAHPYPETLTILEAALPRLEQQGVKLASVSQLLKSKKERRYPPWHVSLFPSPTVAKN